MATDAEPERVLHQQLVDAVEAVLPAHARFLICWIVPTTEDIVNLETDVLSTLGNIPPETITRFGQILTSPPSMTIIAPTGTS